MLTRDLFAVDNVLVIGLFLFQFFWSRGGNLRGSVVNAMVLVR